MKRFSLVLLSLCLVFPLAGCGKERAAEKPRLASEPAAKETPKAVERVREQEPSVSSPAKIAPMKASPGDGPFRAFRVYTDAKAPDNHYIPSGWMGDYGDIKFNDKFMENPHSGTTSIQIMYSNKATQGARWSGIYWQNPPNNWGTRPGGYDLTGAKKLTFWARGDKGGERIEEFKMGGITGEYADSDVAGIGPVVLTTEWQQFTIDLEGKDLSSISGGFCWATNLDVNPEGATFYLDDIKYE